jgi:hypothetical protein
VSVDDRQPRGRGGEGRSTQHHLPCPARAAA